jgi:hypothetical protein
MIYRRRRRAALREQLRVLRQQLAELWAAEAFDYLRAIRLQAAIRRVLRELREVERD